MTAGFERQTAVFAEQKLSLETKIVDLQQAAVAAQEGYNNMRADYEARLLKQEESYGVQIKLSDKRAEDSQKLLDETRATCRSLQDQASNTSQELARLRDDLQKEKMCSIQQKESSDTVGAQLMSLKQENAELVLRAKSLQARYKRGDLVRSI